jgi:hypothetical protein
MARKQVSRRDPEEVGPSEGESADESGKAFLNRRDYVKLGAAAAAVALGAGGSIAATSANSDGAAETFATDFAEYAI